MTAGTEDRLTLTGPHDAIEDTLEACRSDATALSEPIFEACRDHTNTILTELRENSDIAPGTDLTDDRDVTALDQYITNRLTEYWFADLTGRGGDRDLNWNTFKTLVCRYAETAYLRSFTAYKTTNEAFTAIERHRATATTLFDDIETRLQRDQSAPMADGEEPLQSLVSQATDRVTTANERLTEAKTALLRAHAYYTIGECYRDEYDIDPADFTYVSLSDDAGWFLEDLRHRRDRLTTRVRWLRRDLATLQNRTQDA